MSSEKITTIGKRHNTPDDQLQFVYAQSESTGSMFGLEVHGVTLFGLALSGMRNDPEHWLTIEHSPHSARYISLGNLTDDPQIIEYAPSQGDGSSHSATWTHLAEAMEPLSLKHYHRLDEEGIELHLDGLLNMATEGAHREGGGWAVIAEGLRKAQNEMLNSGNRYRTWEHRTMYQGLGYLAANFAERDQAAERAFTAL